MPAERRRPPPPPTVGSHTGPAMRRGPAGSPRATGTGRWATSLETHFCWGGGKRTPKNQTTNKPHSSSLSKNQHQEETHRATAAAHAPGAGTLVGAGTRHGTAKSPPAPGPHHSRPAASGLPTGKLRFPPLRSPHAAPALPRSPLPPGGCPPPPPPSPPRVLLFLLHPRSGTAQGPTGPRSPPLGGSQPAPPAAAAALTAPRRSAGARRRPPFIGARGPPRPPARPPLRRAPRPPASGQSCPLPSGEGGGKRRRGPEPA